MPIIIAAVWLVGWIGFSIIRRRRSGKPIFPKLPQNPLFAEKGCSGRSLRNFWSRMGGARNCLLIAVTPDHLFVSAVFPFNLMFLPEIYGLEHQIPASAIRGVAEKHGLFGHSVTIAYAAPDLQELELRVRKPDALVEALRRLQART